MTQVKTVIFDKTGTLTVGKPSVVHTMLFSKLPLLELCDLAAAAEVSIQPRLFSLLLLLVIAIHYV